MYYIQREILDMRKLFVRRVPRLVIPDNKRNNLCHSQIDRNRLRTAASSTVFSICDFFFFQLEKSLFAGQKLESNRDR